MRGTNCIPLLYHVYSFAFCWFTLDWTRLNWAIDWICGWLVCWLCYSGVAASLFVWCIALFDLSIIFQFLAWISQMFNPRFQMHLYMYNTYEHLWLCMVKYIYIYVCLFICYSMHFVSDHGFALNSLSLVTAVSIVADHQTLGSPFVPPVPCFPWNQRPKEWFRMVKKNPKKQHGNGKTNHLKMYLLVKIVMEPIAMSVHNKVYQGEIMYCPRKIMEVESITLNERYNCNYYWRYTHVPLSDVCGRNGTWNTKSWSFASDDVPFNNLVISMFH